MSSATHEELKIRTRFRLSTYHQEAKHFVGTILSGVCRFILIAIKLLLKVIGLMVERLMVNLLIAIMLICFLIVQIFHG